MPSEAVDQPEGEGAAKTCPCGDDESCQSCDGTSQVPDAARLTDEQIQEALGKYLGVGVGVRNAVRAAEDHTWHARDEEVSNLHDCLDAYIDNEDAIDTRVAQLQEQLDTARAQKDVLVEAGKEAIRHIENKNPHYVIKPLHVAIADVEKNND